MINEQISKIAQVLFVLSMNEPIDEYPMFSKTEVESATKLFNYLKSKELSKWLLALSALGSPRTISRISISVKDV